MNFKIGLTMHVNVKLKKMKCFSKCNCNPVVSKRLNVKYKGRKNTCKVY